MKDWQIQDCRNCHYYKIIIYPCDKNRAYGRCKKHPINWYPTGDKAKQRDYKACREFRPKERKSNINV